MVNDHDTRDMDMLLQLQRDNQDSESSQNISDEEEEDNNADEYFASLQNKASFKRSSSLIDMQGLEKGEISQTDINAIEKKYN